MTPGKFKLLFADDQLLESVFLVDFFANEGFEVDTATTGLAALELLQQNRYDAVVLDNMMAPGGEEGSEWDFENTAEGLHTGLKVLEKIAGMENPPPVWVTTALPDTEVESSARDFPFVQEYIYKDFSMPELARRIVQFCERRSTE